jgi:hypothetical protein
MSHSVVTATLGSGLRAVMAEALYQLIVSELQGAGADAGIRLDFLFDSAKEWRRQGTPTQWTKPRLERAINVLVAAGRIALTAEEGLVVVKLVPKPRRPSPGPPQPPVRVRRDERR